MKETLGRMLSWCRYGGNKYNIDVEMWVCSENPKTDFTGFNSLKINRCI